MTQSGLNFVLGALKSSLPASAEKRWSSFAWHISAISLFLAIWVVSWSVELAILFLFLALFPQVMVTQKIQRHRDNELRRSLTSEFSRELGNKARVIESQVGELAGRVGVVREELELSLAAGVEGVRGELLAEVSELARRVGVVREELESSLVAGADFVEFTDSVRRELRRGTQDSLVEAHIVSSAVSFLYNQICPEDPIWFQRGWAASPELLVEVYRQILDKKPRLVLDIGSGLTTLIAAFALKKNGRGHVVALEHEPGFAEETSALLRKHNLGDWGSLEFSRLVDRRVGSERYSWYDARMEFFAPIELMIVDGPPGNSGKLARYPAVPLLRKRLAPSSVIILDDLHRPDEREIFQKWATELGAVDSELMGTPGREFGILRLKGPDLADTNRLREEY